MIIYGPVPSRRLGQSVGINNIPPKVCSYSCIYCQIGRTNRMKIQRGSFYKPEEIYHEAEVKMNELNGRKHHIDYLSFVPDGEPTLDINLGREIDLLHWLNVKIAVITNASLLWMDDVKKDLMKADWVSLKVDATDYNTWHRLNRPQMNLNIQSVMKGMLDFSRQYKGTLVTETMLVSGINDSKECLEGIGRLLESIKPSKSYLLVPTRPPAERNVEKPSIASLQNALDIIHRFSVTSVECITGNEGVNFYFSDDIENDLLSITAVHPIREDIICKMIADRDSDPAILENLQKKGLIQVTIYEGVRYYKRNFSTNNDLEKNK